MQEMQKIEVWFHVDEGTSTNKLPEMFIKMTVVIISILGIVKITGGVGQVRCCFPDPHDLKRLLAADAGADLKITLQGSSRYVILLRKVLHRYGKVIFLKAMIQDIAHNSCWLKRTFMFIE